MAFLKNSLIYYYSIGAQARRKASFHLANLSRVFGYLIIRPRKSLQIVASDQTGSHIPHSAILHYLPICAIFSSSDESTATMPTSSPVATTSNTGMVGQMS